MPSASIIRDSRVYTGKQIEEEENLWKKDKPEKLEASQKKCMKSYDNSEKLWGHSIDTDIIQYI